jgi:diguanylate cyclase (GGDEF)-like protein
MKLASRLICGDTSPSPTAIPLQTLWLLAVLIFLINYTFEVLDFNHLYESQQFLLVLLQLTFSLWALVEWALLRNSQTAMPLAGLGLALSAQLLIGLARLPLGWLMASGRAQVENPLSHFDLGLAVVYVPLNLLLFLLISKLLIAAFAFTERQRAVMLQRETATRLSAEEEVRTLRAQLERTAYELTENIPVGTYTMVLPPGGAMAKFSFMSRRFIELTGLDRKAAVSDPLQAFACVHPDDYAAWVQLNAEAFARKQPFFGQTRILVHDQVRWITAESRPRALPDGSTVWEGVLIDVTEQVLAKQAAEAARQALQAANVELQRLATTDHLTGAWNRTHLEQTLGAEMGRAERYRQPLSLSMFDIDHFKAINDTHGHLVGDEVLIELTRRIRAQLRTVDVLARWGGEEFVLLLPHCGAAEALRVAEKLRALVAEPPFPQAGQVTASFGLAQWQLHEPLDTWLKRADDALYAAKAAGRNRVRLAE